MDCSNGWACFEELIWGECCDDDDCTDPVHATLEQLMERIRRTSPGKDN